MDADPENETVRPENQQSFPRRRESRLYIRLISKTVSPTNWIPACAGMTVFWAENIFSRTLDLSKDRKRMALRQAQGERLRFSKYRSFSSGFTLLEMLLVLLLLGIAYGLAGPMLGDGSVGLDMKSAARQLAAGLRKARSTAVTGQQEAVLTLDVEQRSFSVTGDPKIYALPKRIDIKLFTAQSEVVGGQSGAIRFFPDGSSTGGRISVGIGESLQEVDVDWLTGRTKIL
jgi:general secretion pathway protein H